MDEAIAALAATEAEQEARRTRIRELEAAETRRLQELAGLRAQVTARLEEAKTQVTYITLYCCWAPGAPVTLQHCTGSWLRPKACACARRPSWHTPPDTVLPHPLVMQVRQEVM